MDVLLLTVAGEELRLKLTTRYKTMVEDKLRGTSLIESMDNLTSETVNTTILWGALQLFNRKNMLEVYDLFDKMTEQGYELNGVQYEEFGANEKIDLTYKIMLHSGVFTKAQIEEQGETMNNLELAIKKPITEKKKEKETSKQ